LNNGSFFGDYGDVEGIRIAIFPESTKYIFPPTSP